MTVIDYIVLVVGIAVVAIVLFGWYHRSLQDRQNRESSTKTGNRKPEAVPAE